MWRVDVPAHFLAQFGEQLAHNVVGRKSICILRFKVFLTNHAARVYINEPRVRHSLIHSGCLCI